jgi:hypothetical protein
VSAQDKPGPAADLAWSVAWIAFGAAVLYGGWAMDRLERQNINPYTAPGLVPGLLGIGIVVMGVLLLVRSLRASRAGTEGGAPGDDLRRLGLALALCLGYGLGLVGHGLPFWLATFVFVFASIALLQLPERRANGTLARGLGVAALCAAGTAAGVTLVFQEVFLVRLP